MREANSMKDMAESVKIQQACRNINGDKSK